VKHRLAGSQAARGAAEGWSPLLNLLVLYSNLQVAAPLRLQPELAQSLSLSGPLLL